MSDFKTPKKKFFPRPLFFWNAKPTKSGLREILCLNEKAGYGGVGVLPYDACKLEYLSDEYFELYGAMLEQSEALGQKVCIYDEWWFPSGSAGGLLKKLAPEACARYLAMQRAPIQIGMNRIFKDTGKTMALIARNAETGEEIDLGTSAVYNGIYVQFEWEKSGEWELLLFLCRLSEWDRVNYLDPAAVEKFLEITHEAYYRRFKKYFGNVIDSVFYDEPQMYAVDGRMWTDDFNEKFFKEKGYRPDLLYPALWYDTADSAFARNELLGFRAELYAKGFPKVSQDWCTKRGISLTGHVDQEEVVNPTGITGDLIKSFKYQDIPGVDEIFAPGRASGVYKIVSSAAYNFDKQLVMVEVFGAMSAERLTEQAMYDELADLFVKGVNYIVPHAIWYDAATPMVPPELTLRDPVYGPWIQKWNQFSARLSAVFQESAHVSRIGVLYPIESLQAEYVFENRGDPYQGGSAPNDRMDYQTLGEQLFYGVGCDFTFVHPEKLVESGFVTSEHTLRLAVNLHEENYSVMILPGQTVMRIAVLKKLCEFFDAGGTVIATSMLPEKSCERGCCKELAALLRHIFGRTGPNDMSEHKNDAGGRGIFIPQPSVQQLSDAIDMNLRDAFFENHSELLGYTHKRAGDCHAYLVNNRAQTGVNTRLFVKRYGKCAAVTRCDPYSGDEISVEATIHGEFIGISLNLPACKCVVYKVCYKA